MNNVLLAGVKVILETHLTQLGLHVVHADYLLKTKKEYKKN